MTLATTAEILAPVAVERPGRLRTTSGNKTLATFVWVAILLLTGEAGLRLRAWQRHGSTAPVADIYEQDALLGRRLRPGATLHGKARQLSINRWGFRGEDIPQAKPPGTVRVAALGDSTAFGMEAADNDSVWVYRMTETLNSAPITGEETPFAASLSQPVARGCRRYDAINGAVPGYTLSVSVDQLTHRIAPFDPDIVVVNQVATDIAAHGRRQFRLAATTQAAASPVGRFIHQHSMLLNLLRQNTAAFRSKQIPEQRHDRLDDRGIAEYAAKLAHLVSLCRERGWRIILCTCPRSFGDESASADQYELAATALANNPALSLAGLNDAFDRYNEAIRQVARTHGALLVDLDRYVPKRAECFADAVHFSDLGHRLVGELVARAIVEVAGDGAVAQGAP